MNLVFVFVVVPVGTLFLSYFSLCCVTIYTSKLSFLLLLALLSVRDTF